ncbi:penicillin-binding protein 1B [Ferrimonas balearica]|uniref:penicillin-binding protein 1B n=1 Tax=Ferrimonas balearica TaxID=44012 RepID=UPI001C99987E|nr:penicillin-binding protein 1B [Ferrimonas balearica]MBY5921554.1 penicillin-binding protein 1B [Ferrimonas balearica]MBY5995106.1 penicillin-binding protein 1B [Ferrimonas balearica]
MAKTAKKAATGGKKRAPKKAVKGTPSRGKRFALFAGKLALAGLAVVALYGIYLDTLIAKKFEGQRWYLPAQVFARPMSLYPGAPVTHKQLKDELALLGYRNTGQADSEGEFAVAVGRIEIFRRAFDGPNGYEAPQRVMVHFNENRVTRLIRSSDGRDMGFLQLEPLLLDRIITGNTEDRLFVPREGIPESLVSALLRTEDNQFYQHNGLSFTGIARAALANLKAGRTVQGGSTLTQQLAKNFFLTRDRTLVRKANEAMMALIIDARYSKDEILEAYLNEVYMGQDGKIAIHGVGLAAWHYFGTPLDELNLAQQALLVAMIKGPSYYNPWRFPERALQRRDLVLKLMIEEGLITPKQYSTFTQMDLALRDPNWRQRHKLPAFRTLMQRELAERFGDNVLNQSGLKVYTTLDPLAQQAAEKAVSQGMAAMIRDRKDEELQAAMVVVDRYNGGVLALVGDRDPSFLGFNRALDARRPVGSLLKPFVYETALEAPQQFSLATPLKDEPINLKSGGGQVWSPQNVDKKFRGQASLLDSLVFSYNVPTVNLGMAVGLDPVISTLRKAGWPSKITANPALLLGALDASPLQVAQLYQTLADGGRYRPLYAIGHVLNKEGERLVEQKTSSEQVLSAQATWLTNWAMTQVVERGTARRLKQRYPYVTLAGKTGTTTAGRDAWYAGFDDRDVVVTWVGRDDNSDAGLYGSSAALPLYQRYLDVREPLSLVLTRPGGIVDGHFQAASGLPVAEDCVGAETLPADSASWPDPRGCQGGERAKNWLERIFSF